MNDWQVLFSDKPEPALQQTLGAGLNAHAANVVVQTGFQPLSVRVVEGTTVRAGIAGLHNWNWLHIQLLWVDESLRGQGLGSSLLERLETAGRERGCEYAHLDTFSYQARPLYEARGYSVFAELEDYPPGQSRYFMKKRLG